MSKLKGIVGLVQNTIDQGASSVEEVHRQIAKQPLELLKNVVPLEDPLNKIQDFQDMSLGRVYELIRTVNQQVGDIAKDILDKAEGEE